MSNVLTGCVCVCARTVHQGDFVYMCRGHLPGSCDTFVIVFGVNCQDADPWANVYQQHGKGIVKATWPLDTVFRIRGVLEEVALRMAIKTNRVDIEQALDQTVQLIQLLQLQIRHLKIHIAIEWKMVLACKIIGSLLQNIIKTIWFICCSEVSFFYEVFQEVIWAVPMLLSMLSIPCPRENMQTCKDQFGLDLLGV